MSALTHRHACLTPESVWGGRVTARCELRAWESALPVRTAGPDPGLPPSQETWLRIAGTTLAGTPAGESPGLSLGKPWVLCLAPRRDRASLRPDPAEPESSLHLSRRRAPHISLHFSGACPPDCVWNFPGHFQKPLMRATLFLSQLNQAAEPGRACEPALFAVLQVMLEGCGRAPVRVSAPG